MNANTFTINNKHLWALAIIVLTCLAYIPVFTDGFTNWDDNIFVTSNELIRSFSWFNIKTWFTQPFVGQYQPLVLLSFAIDYSINGYDPLVFHISNLLFHLVNTFLVFKFIDLLFKNTFVSLLTALLFGIHTLNVESVAWITERKNVLFTLFYLGSLICYLKYLDKNNFKYFLSTLILFVISLASKSAAVTLPVVLVLIDYIYRRDHFKKLVLIEKIPFFALSLFIGIYTIIAHQQYGALSNATGYSFWMRMLISAQALIFYFEKLVLPANLSAYYPLPQDLKNRLPQLIIGFVFMYGIIISSVVIAIKKRNNFILFGLGFFIINLVLFIIPAGVPVLTTDRYTYVPFIGIFLIMAYGLYIIINKTSKLKILWLSLIVSYVLMLSILTFKQSQLWQDSITLWNNVINKTGEASFPLMKRGIAYRHLNDFEKALNDLNASIELDNQYPVVFENRGYIYLLQEDYKNAIQDFNQAVVIDSQSAYSLRNLGLCYLNLQEYEKALSLINQSLEIDSKNAYALKTKGKINIALNKINDACIDLQQSIKLGLSDDNEKEAKALIYKYCTEEK